MWFHFQPIHLINTFITISVVSISNFVSWILWIIYLPPSIHIVVCLFVYICLILFFFFGLYICLIRNKFICHLLFLYSMDCPQYTVFGCIKHEVDSILFLTFSFHYLFSDPIVSFKGLGTRLQTCRWMKMSRSTNP